MVYSFSPVTKCEVLLKFEVLMFGWLFKKEIKNEFSNLLTVEDMKLFDSCSDKDLVKWYLKLNSWAWPDEIGNPVNEGDFSVNDRRDQLMREIASRVGERSISKEWNSGRMTEDQFISFWNNRPFDHLNNICGACKKDKSVPLKHQ